MLLIAALFSDACEGKYEADFWRVHCVVQAVDGLGELLDELVQIAVSYVARWGKKILWRAHSATS